MNTTLLRYPGGKSRAVKQILEYIPDGITEIFSPFLGGASVEIALNNKGTKVYGYDCFKPLVYFWQSVIENPKTLSNTVKQYYPLSKEQFYILQSQDFDTEDIDKITKAAMFYVLNRCSFSGSTLSGGMSPNHPRFNESAIRKIAESKFKNFHVEYADFKESFDKHKDVFTYADPPYMIKNNLYGIKGNLQKGFDHYGLCKILKAKDNWLLSYNDCEEVRQMYKDYKIITLSWKYGMSKEKISSEILIINCKEVQR